MMPEEFENRAECFNLKTLNSTCLKSVFERTPFSFRIGMAVRPNLRNKAAFSNSPGEVLTENFVSVLQNKTQSLLDSFICRCHVQVSTEYQSCWSLFLFLVYVYRYFRFAKFAQITLWSRNENNLSDSGSYVWQCRSWSLSFLRWMWDLQKNE